MKIYKKAAFRIGLAFFLLVGLTFGGELAGSALYRHFYPFSTEYPSWLNWALSFAPLYCLGVPALFAVLDGAPRSIPVRRPLAPGRFLMLACVAYVFLVAGGLLGNGLNAFFALLKGRPVVSPLESVTDGTGTAALFFFTCVLAPLGEELTFRKLLFERVLPFGEKAAILYTALTFGLFHANLYQFFYAFLIGCVLAYLRAKDGRLWPCILLHALINFVGGVAPVLLGSAPDPVLQAAGLALLCALAFGGRTLWMNRRKLRYARALPGARTGLLYANFGWIAAALGCAAVMVYSILQ